MSRRYVIDYERDNLVAMLPTQRLIDPAGLELFIEYDGDVHPLIRAFYMDGRNEIVFMYVSYDSSAKEFLVRKSRSRHQITRIREDKPEAVLREIEAEYSALCALTAT